MPQNPPDFVRLIRALNEFGVRYVVIGGMAMVLHGSDYATVDSDFAVANDLSNTEPIVKALASFHPRPVHRSASEPFPWDARSVFGAVVSLVTDAGDVDLLRVIPGVDSFEGLWARAVTREVFGEEIQVASLEDLIEMKRAANRPKDLNHILELQTLAQMPKESDEEL